MARGFAGTAYIKVEGRQYALRGNLNVSPSNVERTGIAGQDGVHGFMEVPRVPFIEGDFSNVDGLSIEELDAIENATVQADLKNGRSYVLREAWCKAAHEINPRDGQVRVRFEGMSCDEL